jgi:hypothetical protein
MAQTVRLLGVPVDLYLRASRHQHELAREFSLISFGESSGMSEHEVPARLLGLVDQLRGRYSRASHEIRRRFEDAAAGGLRSVDIELPANELAAQLTEDMTDALDAADEFCRSGQLLTLAAPPEVVVWRHWWRDQVVGQIRHGAEPVPYPTRADA